jgi:hypothetical protein
MISEICRNTHRARRKDDSPSQAEDPEVTPPIANRRRRFKAPGDGQARDGTADQRN